MTTRKQLEALLPHCQVIHGHHLTGSGPSRYGWAARTAAGRVQFLARRPDLALDIAKQLGPLFGA